MGSTIEPASGPENIESLDGAPDFAHLGRQAMADTTEQTPLAGEPGLRIVSPPAEGEPLFAPDEIRRIWRDHRRWVAAILLAHKPREVDVEDLLQIVAIAVVRKIGELRDPAAVKPWLRTVAINAARASGREVSRSRRHMKLVRESEAAKGDEAHGAGDAATRREEADRLMALARTLPEGYREPLLMRCVRGMSYKQIGAVLDLPETTIETRIARGRRMLRELAGAKTTESKQAGRSGRPAGKPDARRIPAKGA
jgi:RNA polymerase sigma-70 factor (ECF subfamily)